jgi:SAM-dependent methyltransferase
VTTDVCSICATPATQAAAFTRWSFEITRCANCGVGRTVLPENFDPRTIYREDYFQGGRQDGYFDYQGSESVLRIEFRGIVDQLKRLGFSGGRLLEVGCAYGFFLSEAAQTFKVSGIEMAPEAAAFCQSRGLDVHNGSVDESFFFEREPYDVVVLLDVIEHLTDPAATIRLLSRHVRKGGLLVMSTGNWDSLLSRMMGKYWRLLTPPQHTFYFSPRNLSLLVERFGFQVLECRHPWKRVPLGLIAYQLGRIAGMEKPPVLGRLHGALPLNLFDAFRMAAIKQ